MGLPPSPPLRLCFVTSSPFGHNIFYVTSTHQMDAEIEGTEEFPIHKETVLTKMRLQSAYIARGATKHHTLFFTITLLLLLLEGSVGQHQVRVSRRQTMSTLTLHTPLCANELLNLTLCLR